MSVAEKIETEAGRDFIRDIVQADLDAKRHAGVVTRFPPEPNGYLHIGHAKSICLHFGIAEEFGIAICASMIPIRPRKSRNTSTRSRTMCAGSAIRGAIIFTTHRTISSGCMAGPRN
jgi:tRNA synthetases class I (E and Q), catalytic domain